MPTQNILALRKGRAWIGRYRGGLGANHNDRKTLLELSGRCVSSAKVIGSIYLVRSETFGELRPEKRVKRYYERCSGPSSHMKNFEAAENTKLLYVRNHNLMCSDFCSWLLYSSIVPISGYYLLYCLLSRVSKIDSSGALLAVLVFATPKVLFLVADHAVPFDQRLVVPRVRW